MGLSCWISIYNTGVSVAIGGRCKILQYFHINCFSLSQPDPRLYLRSKVSVAYGELDWPLGELDWKEAVFVQMKQGANLKPSARSSRLCPHGLREG